MSAVPCDLSARLFYQLSRYEQWKIYINVSTQYINNIPLIAYNQLNCELISNTQLTNLIQYKRV